MKEITFSPRRLSISYYCGALGKHLRNKGGIPRNAGMAFGSDVDKVISLFYDKGVYVPGYPELDYVIFMGPKGPASSGKATNFEIIHNDVKYIVRGYLDLLFSTHIVELKTGDAKKWHEIQALSYSMSENKPTRIMYVSREFSVLVPFDEAKILDILEKATINEEQNTTSKSEHCTGCPIRLNCEIWNHKHDLIRSVLHLTDYLDSDHNLSPSRVKYIKRSLNYLKFIAKQVAESDKGYFIDGKNVTPYIGGKGSEKDDSKVSKVQEIGIPDPKKLTTIKDKKPKQIKVTKKLS